MRRVVLLLCALLTLAWAAPSALADEAPPATVAEFGYDLERPPSECIGLLQRPDCGREPEDAGDRGGALQYTVFGMMLGGLALIFVVIFRNVIRADKAKARAALADESAAAEGAPRESAEEVGAEG